MVCCAALTLLIALPLWALRTLRFQGTSNDYPLTWRLVPTPESAPALPRPRARAGAGLAPRLRSFVFAVNGLGAMISTEPNARLHLVATAAAVATGAYLGISAADWRWIALAIAWVWSAEALNTAIERVCDLVSPGPNELVRIAKDVAAGAVLMSALGAALIGLLTFAPYISPGLKTPAPALCFSPR